MLCGGEGGLGLVVPVPWPVVGSPARSALVLALVWSLLAWLGLPLPGRWRMQNNIQFLGLT